MKKLIGAMVLMFTLLSVSYGVERRVMLQWDYPTPPNDLMGFNMYIAINGGEPYVQIMEYLPPGIPPFTMTVPIEVADDTQLQACFEVTAFDNELESEKSNMVCTLLIGEDTTPPPACSNLSIVGVE